MQHNTSLCTIMKNCADVIMTFYNWAVDNFEEINIVVDPENDDDTYGYVMGLQAVNPMVHVLTHKFDDFSSQKQRAYDMCTKQYSVLVDSDEIIEELPDDTIYNIMSRTSADIGSFSRYNFQNNDEYCFGYPDIQYRVIKTGSGIKMNGKVVDERLDIRNNFVIKLPWNIIHYGHIRSVDALKLKGKDRIKFASDDACDGEMLKKYGEEWFIERNKLWNEKKIQVPIYITEYSRKYWKC